MTTPPIAPHTFISATFAPRLPAHAIPPSGVIPWIGARLQWLSIPEPNFGDPHAIAFLLLGGSDGFAVLEGGPLYAPSLIAMPGDLVGVKVTKREDTNG